MRILLLVVGLLAAAPAAVAQNTVHVDPADTNDPSLVPGSYFTVAVKATVNQPNGLIVASFALEYDPAVLLYTNSTPGDFYDQPFMVNNWTTWDGHFFHEALSIGVTFPTSGTYTIATVEFIVVGTGSTALTLVTGDDGVGYFTQPFFLDGNGDTLEANGSTGGSFSNVAPPPPPPSEPPPSEPPSNPPAGPPAAPPASTESGKGGSGRDGCGGSAGARVSPFWMIMIAALAIAVSRRMEVTR